MRQKAWLRLRRALEEVLEVHSFDEVTIDMLSRQAGITRQAFYYYYHSLPEYVSDLLRQELKNMPVVNDSAAELLRYLLKKEEDLHDILKKLYGSSYEREADRIIRECLRTAVQNPVKPEVRLSCLEYVLYGLIKDRIEERNTDPRDIVFRHYVGAVSTILRIH